MTPSIGIDLDGTIDEAPIFFRVLCNHWPGKVFIITYRDDRQKAVDRLAEFEIRYDELILVSTFEEKAKVVQDRGILTYFDDMDEMTKEMPFQVNVMKVRNAGNFDFGKKLWLYDDNTGRQV